MTLLRRDSFFFSSRRRHTRCSRDWSSDVCSSDLIPLSGPAPPPTQALRRQIEILTDAGESVRDVPSRLVDDGDDLGVRQPPRPDDAEDADDLDRKSTRLNSSHGYISYAVFCLKKKKIQQEQNMTNVHNNTT